MKYKQEHRDSISSRLGVVSRIGKIISASKRLVILVGLMDDSKAFQRAREEASWDIQHNLSGVPVDGQIR